MNPPMENIDLTSEKLEKEKDGGPMFHCDLCDKDTVHKIAEAFLPGLASACIDNTTGGILNSPVSVAVDIRREMVEYLIRRSESFVVESVVLEGDSGVEISENPYDIVSDFVDDFVSTKRNFFSRVSGWLLSDRREDRIDDLVQEMEINGFWLLNRRNSIAQTLLKKVDFKNKSHCSNSFKTHEDLEEHKLCCSFRTMSCSNMGCNSTFSAAQMEYHESVCPFKILQCEQKCLENIMRREMDRHCITICPMKLVKCPFYSFGCQSLVPQCTIDQHRYENLGSHLLYTLQVIHNEASTEALKERVEELEKLSSPGKLVSIRDARTFTNAIKDLDAKLGPVKTKQATTPTEEDIDLVDENESTDSLIKIVLSESSSRKKKEMVESIHVQENLKESTLQREESPTSPTKVELQIDKSSKEQVVDPVKEYSTPPIKQKQQHSTSPIKQEDEESITEREKHDESHTENEHV